MPFNKRSLFLAATAIELALLLGYGRAQYTGNCTIVLNTTVAVGIEGRGCTESGKRTLPRGQLDDEDCGRVLHDAGDSQASKPKACRCAAMRSW